MKKIISFFAIAFSCFSNAQTPLIHPSTLVQFGDGDIASPNGKKYPNLFDGDSNTIFSDMTMYDGAEVIFDLGRPHTIGGFRIILGNGNRDYDPISVVVKGYNDLNAPGDKVGEVGDICGGRPKGDVLTQKLDAVSAPYRYYSMSIPVLGTCSYGQIVELAEFQIYAPDFLSNANFDAMGVLKLYPTLVDDKCYIDNKEALVLETVEVFGLEGKVLKVVKGDIRDFDMSDLSSGAYIVKVKSVNGYVSVQKVVKK